MTEILADVIGKPMFIVPRTHHLNNLADLFFTNKKKIYLSYPITAVRESDPELLARIQGPVLADLEKLFVVFNPLDIKDMPLTYIKDLTLHEKELIKKRTIERDFQFIDQSDAVVVMYFTDKVSPGVLAEIYYAHRNQKPVFMVFPGGKSPFIEDATTFMADTLEELMVQLREFAGTVPPLRLSANGHDI